MKLKLEPSPFKFLFLVFVTVFGLSLGFMVLAEEGDTLQKKLYDFGYPKEGYTIQIVENGTKALWRFPDGKLAIMDAKSGYIIKELTVTPWEAKSQALNYLMRKFKGAAKAGVKFRIVEESLKEYEENGRHYWRFLWQYKYKGRWIDGGYIIVARDNPDYVKLRFILEG